MLTTAVLVQLSAFAAAHSRKYISSIADPNDRNFAQDPVLSGHDVSQSEYPVTLIQTSYGSDSPVSDPHEQRDAEAQQATSGDVQLSTWTPTKKNVLVNTEDVLCITLLQGETATFVGEYDVCVRTGAVTLCGALLYPDVAVLHVFAPSTHALPQIQCVSSRHSEIEIRKSYKGIMDLQKVSPLYRRVWDIRGDKRKHDFIQGTSFSFIQTSADDPRLLYPLDIPPQWKHFFLEKSHRNKAEFLRILVCGKRDSGKSTFCRLLANSILTSDAQRERNGPGKTDRITSVFWLDLDPGQSEFNPSGQVSLVQLRQPVFGPPFTHAYVDPRAPNHLIRAHAIGDLSPASDPDFFIACATNLCATFEESLNQSHDHTLVINCPGWSQLKGIGQEVTKEIISTCSPTDVVILGEPSSQGITDTSAAATNITVHSLPSHSRPTFASARSPSELRNMQNISYFHSIASELGEAKWSPTSVIVQQSWIMSYGRPDADILGILIVAEAIPKAEFYHDILDRWLVAIGIVDDDLVAEEALSKVRLTGESKLPYWPIEQQGHHFRPPPSKSHTIGWGYVTSIDVENQTIELKTPMPDAVRKEAQVRTQSGHPRLILIRGKIDVPSWAYLEGVYSKEAMRRSGETDLTPAATNGIADLDRAELPEDYDLGTRQIHETSEIDYVRLTRPGQEGRGVGAREWTLKPRIARSNAKSGEPT